MKPKVCISYSSIDKDFLTEMIKIMNSLKDLNLIEPWTDQSMQAGDLWDEEIKKNFTEADIYLLLLSSDFINSSYIKNVEKEIITQSEVFTQSLVIPIFIRECDFEAYSWMDQINGLPTKKKWIGGHDVKDRDALYTEISIKLREKIISFIASREEANKLFFGVTERRPIFQERCRVFGELRGLSKKNPTWNVDFTPDDAVHDELLELNEIEFKKAIKEELHNATFCSFILDEKVLDWI